MKKILFAIALFLIGMLQVSAQSDVTAAQVNGTWKMKGSEFKIWALGQKRLQIEFSGIYEYKTPQGPMANDGQGSGTARIEGDTAVFKPDGAEDNARSRSSSRTENWSSLKRERAALGTTSPPKAPTKKFRGRNRSSTPLIADA